MSIDSQTELNNFPADVSKNELIFNWVEDNSLQLKFRNQT